MAALATDLELPLERRRARGVTPAPDVEPVVSRGVLPTPREVLALQRTAGNRAVARLIAGAAPGALSADAVEHAVAYVTGRHYGAELIKAIQSAAGVAADGDYGPVSARAVAAWQRAHGMAGDGKAGPATLAAMGLAGAPGHDGAAPQPAAPAAAAPAGAAAPASPAPAPAAAPVSGSLEELMAKPRLTPDELTTARERIAAVPDAAQRAQLFLDLQSKVTYHSQRDNASVDHGEKIGDKMCNLTSLAMCLEYLGVPNPHPEMQFEDALEKLRVEKVGKPRTDAAGWGAVANLMGVQFGFIDGAGANDQAWYEANVRTHLAAGEAVMLSIQGHICRLQGMTENGLVADDPFGHSKLKLGKERGWGRTNKAGKNEGEDITWPWEDVKQHTMKWIAWFKR